MLERDHFHVVPTAKEIGFCLDRVSRQEYHKAADSGGSVEKVVKVVEWESQDRRRINDAILLWSFSGRIDAFFCKTIKRIFEGIKRISR